MVKIRLARIGKKKQPTYRLIVSDSKKDTYGTFLENLGSYDPRTKKASFEAEKIKYWMSKGAQLTNTVHNLLVENKVIEGKKRAVSKIKIAKRPKPEEAKKEEKKPEVAVEKPKEEAK